MIQRGPYPPGAVLALLLIGVGATAVYAKQLSERGLKCAVKAGHTYAKIGGVSGPTLRFTGKVPGARKQAIFGDTARGRSLNLKARATGGGVLQLVRDASVIATGSGSIAANTIRSVMRPAAWPSRHRSSARERAISRRYGPSPPRRA